MKVIALTSANEAGMAKVAEWLLEASRLKALNLSVLIGINTAHEATAVYSGTGELWRIGEDSTHPELDALIDVQIDDMSPLLMARLTALALDRFLKKHAAAAPARAPAAVHTSAQRIATQPERVQP